MAKRGRPPTNGIKDGGIFLRDSIAVQAFQQARPTHKYEYALEMAAEAVRNVFPEMRISPSTVKKILKEWMPESSQTVCLFSMTEEVTGDGKTRTVYGMGFGERPYYPHPSNWTHHRG